MKTEYRQELGFQESLAIIIGKIIGSGIFKTPAPIMLISGSLTGFFATWIVGGILTFLNALLYAEMVAAFPRSGGPYEYLKRAYPPIIPFLRGWAMFFVSETASIILVAIVFSEYVLKILSYFFVLNATIWLEMSITVGLVWFFTFFNTVGLKFAGWFQDVLSLMKVLSLLYIIYAGFSFTGLINNIQESPYHDFSPVSLALGVGASLRYSLFAYSGWEGATYVAEEVKNPKKTLPLSLFTGILVVMLLYLGVNLAYLSQLTPGEIAKSKFVAADVMERALGPAGAIAISLIIAINTSGNVNAQIFTKARTWQAMSRDGLFFPYLKALSSRALPVRSLVVQAAWATVLAVLAYSSYFLKTTVSIYDRLIDFFAFTSSLFNVLTVLAVWVLRKKYPAVERPFKVPFFYPVFLIVLSIYGYYAISTLISAFWESVTGLILTSSGFLYWYLGIRPHLKEHQKRWT